LRCRKVNRADKYSVSLKLQWQALSVNVCSYCCHMLWVFTYCSAPVQQTAVRVLQAKHVTPQVSCENYVCLWVGCKVYARTSCSRSWLERHVLSHGGNKPFRCIVDGCGQRFSSQVGITLYTDFPARIAWILLQQTL